MKQLFHEDPYLYSVIKEVCGNIAVEKIEYIFRKCSSQESWRIADIERYYNEIR